MRHSTNLNRWPPIRDLPFARTQHRDCHVSSTVTAATRIQLVDRDTITQRHEGASKKKSTLTGGTVLARLGTNSTSIPDPNDTTFASTTASKQSWKSCAAAAGVGQPICMRTRPIRILRRFGVGSRDAGESGPSFAANKGFDGVSDVRFDHGVGNCVLLLSRQTAVTTATTPL